MGLIEVNHVGTTYCEQWGVIMSLYFMYFMNGVMVDGVIPVGGEELGMPLIDTPH